MSDFVCLSHVVVVKPPVSLRLNIDFALPWRGETLCLSDDCRGNYGKRPESDLKLTLPGRGSVQAAGVLSRIESIRSFDADVLKSIRSI